MKSEIWFSEAGHASDYLKLVFMKSEIQEFELSKRLII